MNDKVTSIIMKNSIVIIKFDPKKIKKNFDMKFLM
jgi:hypothetical protein